MRFRKRFFMPDVWLNGLGSTKTATLRRGTLCAATAGSGAPAASGALAAPAEARIAAAVARRRGAGRAARGAFGACGVWRAAARPRCATAPRGGARRSPAAPTTALIAESARRCPVYRIVAVRRKRLRSPAMARHLALSATLLALLACRADASCATATAAVAVSVAAGGACVDTAAGNSAATCSATCTAILDGWVSGCKAAPLPDATPFTVLALGLPLNATLSACRSAFLARARTFATQTGATDRARPWSRPRHARGARNPRASPALGRGGTAASTGNTAALGATSRPLLPQRLAAACALQRARVSRVPSCRVTACSQLTIYMGAAVRDYGVCPKGASLPCTPGCQTALNELAVYCTATQPINTPANVLLTFGLTCNAPTCSLADAAASTWAAMYQLGVPNTCAFPFPLPPASAAQRGAGAHRVIAAAVSAAAAAALL